MKTLKDVYAESQIPRKINSSYNNMLSGHRPQEHLEWNLQLGY